MQQVRKVGQGTKQCEAVRLLRIFVKAAGHYQRQRDKLKKSPPNREARWETAYHIN